MLNRRRALMAQGGTSPRLPSEYQEVEWIQGDGTAQILTGITPTVNSAMKAEMAAQSQTQYNFLGSRDGSSGVDKAFLVASYNSAHKFGFMRWGYGVQTIAFDTNWHEYYLSPTEAKVDGVDYALNSPKSQTSTKTIKLFKENVPSGGAIYIALKYFKFWDDGDLIADYIPCYRKSDGVIGMYDLVTNAFKVNAEESGTFTKGSDI